MLSNLNCFYNTDTKGCGGKKLRFHLGMVAHTWQQKQEMLESTQWVLEELTTNEKGKKEGGPHFK